MTRSVFASLSLLLVSLILPHSARAGDPLGTVTEVVDTSCPPGGLTNSTCEQLTIACPNVATQTMTIKMNTPTGTNLGTVVFLSGGGGIGFYDSVWVYGSAIVNAILQTTPDTGFVTVQLNWYIPNVQANINGWLQGPGGPRILACRVATATQWVQSNIQSGGAFCATGSSGGAGALAYLLDDYGLAMDFAEFTSGPVFSRIDWGCDNVQPYSYSPATGEPTTLAYLPADDVAFLNPSYQDSDCLIEDLQHSTQWDPIFLESSIMWPGADYTFTSATHFLYGALDTGNPPVQGYLFEQAIHSTDAVVPGAAHELGDSLAGAQQIAADVTGLCKEL
jgi:hypothetical protein